MDWNKVIEVLQSLPEETRAKKATMLVNDEYWFIDLMQSAMSGEVYVTPLRVDDGEETDSS